MFLARFGTVFLKVRLGPGYKDVSKPIRNRFMKVRLGKGYEVVSSPIRNRFFEGQIRTKKETQIHVHITDAPDNDLDGFLANLNGGYPAI